MNVALAEARDIDPSGIDPQIELKDSNYALGDKKLLDALYEEQGYLLFRGVLDLGTINRALRRMMTIMARHGVVSEDATEPMWAGKPTPAGMEESPEFSGICLELVEDPANQDFFESLLGERPASVPIVQYRSYSPGTAISMVHQDGFFSPGIHGFRPVWMPLMTIDRKVGSLMLVPGAHKNGLIHNLAKPPNFPIPAEMIPDEHWATTTFHAGDVLIIHPHTPHVGMANTSDRVRFSIDTRIQSADRPCVLLGDVVATRPDALTIRTAQGDRTIGIGADTYIRTGENRGSRIPLPNFQDNTPAGLRVVVAIDGDQATMIRRASEG